MMEKFEAICKKCGSKEVTVERNGDGYGVFWVEFYCKKCDIEEHHYD